MRPATTSWANWSTRFSMAAVIRERLFSSSAQPTAPFASPRLSAPGAIQPLHGIRSKTRAYRLFYGLAGPLLTVLRHFAPQWILTTDSLGRAMIAIGRHGAGKAVLESRDLSTIG
jgi:hypothetical protein